MENNLKGVYELSSNEKIFYPFAENKVIYIGSSNNLKKRLKTYTSKTAHTNDIKNFIKDNEKIYFRIIKTFDYQEHEKELIDTFINLYGDLPRLNTQRILKEFIIVK
ncbi:GIY-YIG nuclease family protein [Aliarcobacter butzleri]|nr:GIY-YIG nuclease family protein [Aliarcobacter butzleri]